MSFRHLKIATRLGLGFGLIALLLILVIALGLNSMQQIQNRMNEATKVNNVETRLAQTMDLSVTERALAVRNLILLKNEKEIQLEVERISEQEKRYEAAQGNLSRMFERLESTSAEEIELLEQIKKQSLLATPFVQRASALALAQKQDEAYQVLRYEFRPIQKRWWELMRKLIAVEENQNSEGTAIAEAEYVQARVMMLSIGSLALIASLVAAVLITTGISKQLGCEPAEAVEIASQIADGNLAVRINTRSGDTHSLLFAMRSMRDSLGQIVQQVHMSTETITTAAGQIAIGNLDLSSRTEQQASTLEETASSMEELTSTVRLNADHAHQANELAAAASSIASQGGTVVAQVVHTMAAIDISARKIVDIIAVIDGIAFQTNILALNAAVEAARAGELGRGFAVVAAEVRSLAQRSATAAKEIKDLIGDSVEKVQAGNKLVDQAGTTMHEVVVSVKRVTDIMSEMMSASQEQSSGIEQINMAIMQMDNVTQQNAALVEEAAAAAQALQEQVHCLNDVVRVFQLDSRFPALHPVRQPVTGMVPPVMPKPPLIPATTSRAGQYKTLESEWQQF